MYGLVNKAIQELVIERYDEEAWERILEESAIDEEGFIGMDPYPDDLTFALIDTASRVLGIEVPPLLELFGEYWVHYAAREGYEELLDMAGTDLDTFLSNLDRIHDRVSFTFPQIRSPRFSCATQADGTLVLEYRSVRQGLAFMVLGVLRGLAKRFRESISIEHLQPDRPADPHHFHIRRVAA